MTAELISHPVDLFLLMSEDPVIPEGVIKRLDFSEADGELDISVKMKGTRKPLQVSIPSKLRIHRFEENNALHYYLDTPDRY